MIKINQSERGNERWKVIVRTKKKDRSAGLDDRGDEPDRQGDAKSYL